MGRDLLFFSQAGGTNAQPKLAYVAMFEPWHGYFLAGAYIDDLDAEFRGVVLRMGAIGGGVLLVMLAAGLVWLDSHATSLARSAG